MNYEALILDFHRSRARKPPLVSISSGRGGARGGTRVEDLLALPPQPAVAIYRLANPFH